MLKGNREPSYKACMHPFKHLLLGEIYNTHNYRTKINYKAN